MGANTLEVCCAIRWARLATIVLALAALAAGAGCQSSASPTPMAAASTLATRAVAALPASTTTAPIGSATPPVVAASPANPVAPTPSPSALPSGYELQPPTATVANGYPAPYNTPTPIVPTPTSRVSASSSPSFTSASVVGSVPLTYTRIAAIGGNVGAVEAEGSHVYSVDISDNLTIYDGSNPSHLVVLSRLAVPTHSTVIQIHNGVLYVLGPEQLSLIDVRNAFQPRLLSSIAISSSVNTDFPPYRHAKLYVEGGEAILPTIPSPDRLQLTVINVSDPSHLQVEKEATIHIPGTTIGDAAIMGDYVAITIANEFNVRRSDL